MRAKILLVSNMWPSSTYPHYGAFVVNSMRALQEDGFVVVPLVISKSHNKLKKAWSYVLFYVRVFFAIVFGSYDAVYVHYLSHCAPPILAAYKLQRQTPIVCNAHGNDVVPENKADEKMCKYTQKLLNISTAVISPSKYFTKELTKYYGIPVSKVFSYPSGGIDDKLFYPRNKNEMKKKFGFSEHEVVVGMFGRLEKDKGWDTFIDAACVLQQTYADRIRFFVIGGGAEEEQFRATLVTRGIEKRFCVAGLCSQEKLAEAYSAVDVYVFPTRRKSESLGLVGLEAMACGSLVVAGSKYGPSSYMENGKNGFTFDPTNAADLAHVVQSCIDLPSVQRQEIIEAAQKTALRFNKNTTAPLLTKVFHEIINNEELAR